MRHVFAFALIALPFSLPVSPLAAQTAQVDDVSRKASQLEAELGKLKDTTPEAADLMLQLVDMYYADGRVFGLIGIGEKFVGTHPTNPRHKEVMLKLIDGLQATSRNKELTAACRQFIGRYNEDPSVAKVEELLAVTLNQAPDRLRSAEAHEAVWRRQPTTPVGKRAGATAISQYGNLNTAPGFVKAAELSEAMLGKLPAGEFVAHTGLQGVYYWQRVNDWAKSNRVAHELLKKNLPADKTLLRQLHITVAENYSRLGQRANAVESYKKARAIVDAPYLHYQMVVELYNGGGKGAELEPLVNEYFQKYADRQDRFALRSYVANAFLRDNDKPKALAILAELLPFDAATNGNATVFVRENGVEPAQLARTEQVLTEALAKNEPHAYLLRWSLGFDLYRDRVKNLDKARRVIRELIAKSPTNDSYSQQSIQWLLNNPANEDEFKADVAEILKVRREKIQWPAHRGYLAEWIKATRPNKELRDRVLFAQGKLDEQDADPFFKDWLAGEVDNRAKADPARAKLLEAASLKTLNDGQAWALLYAQANSYYNLGNNEQRSRATGVYADMAKRFPTNYDVAYWYLLSASNYSPPEVHKEAALHMLSLEPKRHDSNYDIWYRLMIGADRMKDAELTQRSFAWITKGYDQFGTDVRYAELIGDYLEKYGFKNEALAWWQRNIAVDRNNYYSRACAERVLSRLPPPERAKLLAELVAAGGDYHGVYSMWLAGDQLKANELPNFVKTLTATRALQDERPFRNWGIEEAPVQAWVDQFRASTEAPEADKRQVYAVVRDLRMGRPSASAALALLELPPAKEQTPMQRLLAYQDTTTMVGDDTTDWDRLAGHAQVAMTRKDYVAVATLVSGMLSNIPSIDAGRQKSGRDMVAQSYARMGAVGLAIDESSPIAPLLQAALYLRLGDQRLAFDAYLANKKLFDERRDELPVDLILFVCESHITAGGDENHERAEDILRNWLVKFSEAKDLEDSTKASVQLLLAKNYFKSQRYDVARGEYTTVMNRYPNTSEATEAEFGIGESFMAQKVYDQAEAVFEKLANSRERDVIIRAEFLRGVLANRRGDLDEARDIFRGVLEMVPSVELANQALFNLSEVYGSEQRYIDQLELLRTVGRLGRASKRWHTPGVDLSIVVQDSDLGVSRGHAKIPVRVTTEPGGDQELIYLYSGGAGKGLFRADLPTRLGQVTKGDKVLQLTGKDTIKCDYPDEFKAEFRSAPLSDAEIRIASDGRFEVASSKIIDKEKETFTDRLAREEKEQEAADQRVSQNRPVNQIKPGNLVYLRVQDADRDLSDEADTVIVKLAATSGDQVQIPLKETGPHTGQFEGTGGTGELPAGALASDTAIDHNPLMAIDQDPKTYWMSAPDGATPKWLSVDMKDLRSVSHVTTASPDGKQHAPLRGYLEGSHDGRFWFRLASIPPQPQVEPVAGEYAQMSMRLYAGNYLNLTQWQQVIDLSKNGKPQEQAAVEQLSWVLPPDAEDAKKPHAVIFHGKFVQPKSGAVRFAVQAGLSALSIDRELHLPLAAGNRTVDVWLDRGTHDLTVFGAVAVASQAVTVTRAREDYNAAQVVLSPFRTNDFDLKQPGANAALPRKPAKVTVDNGVWDFQFDPYELRHVKLTVQEYLGEAVAINHVEIRGEEDAELYIPTKADVLALANNDVLEIAAGDLIKASYTDEFTQSASGRSQLLTADLTATYFNASLGSIGYDFVRQNNGQVANVRKQLIRIDPGERFVVEVTDYDLDTTGEPDEITIQVAVNDGEPLKLTAKETGPYTGVFTKEVDTAAMPAKDKLLVKKGDQVYASYLDAQNTFPGHAVAREAVVFVNQPSEGRLRVVETRVVRPKTAVGQPADVRPPQTIYMPAKEAKEVTNVAFEAPLTIEVYDRDAAKDSRSNVVVQLTTSDGAKVDVNCVVSNAFSELGNVQANVADTWALEEGRFVGQVILQLGSRHTADLVPLTASMPRNLVGGPKLSDDEGAKGGDTLVTRVLNLTGKDIIQATYKDALRPDGKPADLLGKGRLIANGVLICTDRDYKLPITQLHVGEKMFLSVADADLDVSDERDAALVEITSERGEREVVSLEETLAHSGLFTGSVTLKPAESPTAGNLAADDPSIESYFGDLLKLKYVDKAASTETGELELEVEIPVVIGTDGLVAAFSKTFNDETLAVETQFHIAESYFELFKSHKKLERKDDLRTDLEAGRRVLREVMEDYPDPKYVPRIAYLLGQFAQELGQWREAIDSYQMIVRQHPDHTLAADSQYKLAQCHEEAGDFDEALEAYVTLAATYPKSPLIANVMIRISERFYRDQNFEVAAQVGEKFLERFEGHEWGPRMAFRIGQCYYKAKQYRPASLAFDRFAKQFPDDALASDALFWSGESFRMANNNPLAFQRYNRCRWDFPSSDAAKYSRGRLALPAMLAEFERAANVEE